MDRITEMLSRGISFPQAVDVLAAEDLLAARAGVIPEQAMPRPAPEAAETIGDRTTPEQRALALELTLKHLGSYAFPPDETIDLARKLALFIAEG